MEKTVIDHFTDTIKKGNEYASNWEWKTFPYMPKCLRGRILEVGSGARLVYYSDKIETWAIDITPEMAKLCKKAHPNASVIIGDVKKLPFVHASFDTVISISLLHHLIGRTPKHCSNNIKNAMREIKLTLKPKGYWLIHEAMVSSYLITILMFYITLFCAKFGIEINSLDIHSKVVTFFLTWRKFNKLFHEIGFEGETLGSGDWKIYGIMVGKNLNVIRLTK